MTRIKTLIAFACAAAVLTACGSKQAKEEPAPAAAPAAAEAAPTPMVEATAASLNIRAKASPSGAVLGSLKRGERATVLAPEAGGWTYVESESGVKGYVSSQYTREVAGSAAPAATATAAAPAAAGKPAAAAKTAGNAPPGSKLARVTVGMNEAQVIEILGQPTSQQSYFSGKVFIPWGRESGKMDYRYKGVGIVTFSHHRYSGANSVVRTIYDPNEDGFK
jgi:uncharacterized protein YgiM (DUF1202 family)